MCGSSGSLSLSFWTAEGCKQVRKVEEELQGGGGLVAPAEDGVRRGKERKESGGGGPGRAARAASAQWAKENKETRGGGGATGRERA